MKKFIFLALALFSLNTPLFALEVIGTVVKVYDGDTLTIKSDQLEKPKSVRMIGIDTPEINFQGEGQGEISITARDYLESLVPVGSTITVDLGKKGSLTRRRLLGTVYMDDQNVNLEMIKSGHAAVYLIDPVDKNLYLSYMEAAKYAYENQLGFYSKTDIMPYEFRMIVQNRKGTNYVGDFASKVLYLPEEVDQVLPYNRIFIRTVERAQELGYTLRKN